VRERSIQGRVWILVDATGRLIEDIDTDQIFHNAHLHITDIAQMGQHALGNLEGWRDFPKKCAPGDILVAGRNFGAGSSRQQAVDCFIALGIAAVLAPSFSAIYFRNAVNSGFPVLRGRNIEALVEAGRLQSGDRIALDLETGGCGIQGSETKIDLEPMSPVQRDIFRAGSLFAFGKSRA
jgi:3-isopropylmalate/(R)-2-methylmalate dehydratase small subunit